MHQVQIYGPMLKPGSPSKRDDVKKQRLVKYRAFIASNHGVTWWDRKK